VRRRVERLHHAPPELEGGRGRDKHVREDEVAPRLGQAVGQRTTQRATFEDLFWKYKDKVSAPPEVRLLMMVGGSAMMFHYTLLEFRV
jgi:hypothetical protein